LWSAAENMSETHRGSGASGVLLSSERFDVGRSLPLPDVAIVILKDRVCPGTKVCIVVLYSQKWESTPSDYTSPLKERSRFELFKREISDLSDRGSHF
jgi:hypothetical protein